MKKEELEKYIEPKELIGFFDPLFKKHFPLIKKKYTPVEKEQLRKALELLMLAPKSKIVCKLYAKISLILLDKIELTEDNFYRYSKIIFYGIIGEESTIIKFIFLLIKEIKKKILRAEKVEWSRKIKYYILYVFIAACFFNYDITSLTKKLREEQEEEEPKYLLQIEASEEKQAKSIELIFLYYFVAFVENFCYLRTSTSETDKENYREKIKIFSKKTKEIESLFTLKQREMFSTLLKLIDETI